jgi:hypothetical protein
MVQIEQIFNERLTDDSVERPIDFQDIFQKFTFDSFGKIGFGLDWDTLHKDIEFSKAFDGLNEGLVQRVINPLWKVEIFFNES